MDADIAALTPFEAEQTINSLIVPRPIAWITSQDAAGVGNLAPFSYFTVVSRSPPLILISFASRKDTLNNIEATGEFVVNVVSAPMAAAMVQSSAPYPPDVDESAVLGLPLTASVRVKPPRLAGTLGALECRWRETIGLGDSLNLIGEILHLHVSPEVEQGGRVSMKALQAVGRLGGSQYVAIGETLHFDKPQPPPGV